MSVKEAARVAPRSSGRRDGDFTGQASMSHASTERSEPPIVTVTSPKLLAIFAGFLSILATGFLSLFVHVWNDFDKHFEKIDSQLAGLAVTQGKFEQFLTSQLPGIVVDLRRNTDLISKLESNVGTLAQSVSQVQHQVSVATDEIAKLKAAPMRKGSLGRDEPDDRPTATMK